MFELIVFYAIPLVIALIGVVLTLWGNDTITIGDVCIAFVMVFMPGLNLICAAMFINILVTEVLIPMTSFIWDRPIWRKKDK